MADLTGAAVKINDVEVAQDAPVTEALLNKMGVDINSLIDSATAISALVASYGSTIKLGSAALTSASGTWTAPANLKGGIVFAFGVGGGGGGGGGGGNGATGCGGNGGCGAALGMDIFNVTPNVGYAYIVGQPGAGGAPGTGANGSAGGNGTPTRFDGTIISDGASGGAGGDNATTIGQLNAHQTDTRTSQFGAAGGGTLGGRGGKSVDGIRGQPGYKASGGVGGPVSSRSGGGGGGGSYGAGGTGGTGGVDDATAASNYGAGGGGGCGSNPTGGNGRAGSQGFLVLLWVESAL